MFNLSNRAEQASAGNMFMFATIGNLHHEAKRFNTIILENDKGPINSGIVGSYSDRVFDKPLLPLGMTLAIDHTDDDPGVILFWCKK